jgi:hypothetical protein
VLHVDAKAQLQRRPTCTQVVSQLKTRLSSRAQLMRRGRPSTASTSHSVSAVASVAACACAGGPCGTTTGRSLAFGARTPWFVQRGSAHFAQRSYADTKLMRCSLGRGTGARTAPFGRPRRQPLHELQRAHHQVRGSIAPRGLELQLHLAGGVELHPLGAQGLACRVLAWHALQAALALCMREPFARHGTVRRDGPMSPLSTPQGQHLLPGARSEGDAIG